MGAGPEDAVTRLCRFRERYPDVQVTPPGTASGFWTAERDGQRIAGPCYWLGKLMDTLAARLGDPGI